MGHPRELNRRGRSPRDEEYDPDYMDELDTRYRSPRDDDYEEEEYRRKRERKERERYEDDGPPPPPPPPPAKPTKPAVVVTADTPPIKPTPPPPTPPPPPEPTPAPAPVVEDVDEVDVMNSIRKKFRKNTAEDLQLQPEEETTTEDATTRRMLPPLLAFVKLQREIGVLLDEEDTSRAIREVLDRYSIDRIKGLDECTRGRIQLDTDIILKTEEFRRVDNEYSKARERLTELSKDPSSAEELGKVSLTLTMEILPDRDRIQTELDALNKEKARLISQSMYVEEEDEEEEDSVNPIKALQQGIKGLTDKFNK